jgi:hypothetical protein
MFRHQTMEPFSDVPATLVLLPVGLAVLDGIYKRVIFKHAPYDGVADIALAALTFSAVHLITKSMPPHNALTVPAGVIIVVIAQFAAWPLALTWSRWLRDSKSGIGIGVSYCVGILWFVYSVGRLLLYVPA